MHEWWENFYAIVSKGDNIPIVAMLFIVGIFLAWGLREARGASCGRSGPV